MPARLDLVAGALSYVAGAGAANILTVSRAGDSYTFHDTGETIVLGSGALAAGWTGDGTDSVTGPVASVSSIAIALGDLDDALVLGPFDGPVAPLGSVTGGGDAGDTATIAAAGAGITAAGGVSFTGFATIDVSNRITTSAGGAVTLTAGDTLTISPAGVITAAGAVLLRAQNAITLNAALDATAAPITIEANQDGAGTEGFTMGPGTGLTTTNATAAAVSITVNTPAGGTGAARVRGIVVGRAADGSGGTVTVNAHNGLVGSAGGPGRTITAGSAVLIGDGVVVSLTVSRVEGSGGSGGFHVGNNEALTIGGVSALVGVSSTNDEVSILALGPLTVEERVTSETGDISLIATRLLTVGADLVTTRDIFLNSLDSSVVVANNATLLSAQATVEMRSGANFELRPGTSVQANGVLRLRSFFSAFSDHPIGTPLTFRIGGRVRSVTSTITLLGSGGSDVFIIDDNGGAPDDGGRVSNVLSPITIDGRGNASMVILDDTGETAGKQSMLTTLTGVTNRFVQVGAAAGDPSVLDLTLVFVDGLTLNAGQGDDALTVRSLGRLSRVQLNAGAGNDTITVVAEGGDPESRSLTVNGQGGTDTLEVNGAGQASSTSWGMTETFIGGLRLPARITYGAVEALNILLGTDHDTFTIFRTHAGSTRVSGGSGNDTITIVSTAGPTSLVGGAGGDRFVFSNGATLSGGTIDGGNGTDFLDYRDYVPGVVVDLRGNNSGGTGAATGTGGVRGMENVIGGRGGDRLTGDDGPNRLEGLAGKDTILGLDGDDVLLGGPGNDRLVGGGGRDTVSGGPGRDQVSA